MYSTVAQDCNAILIFNRFVKTPAIEEASSPGKQQIDLMDGEEFINKLAEFGIGVKEVKDYDVDEDFFANL